MRLFACAYAYVHMRESDSSGAVNQYGARIFESPQQNDQFGKKKKKKKKKNKRILYVLFSDPHVNLQTVNPVSAVSGK